MFYVLILGNISGDVGSSSVGASLVDEGLRFPAIPPSKELPVYNSIHRADRLKRSSLKLSIRTANQALAALKYTPAQYLAEVLPDTKRASDLG